jgi:ketosteroid isomerase-like protein
MDADRDAVWTAVTAIYDAFLAGDRAAVDARLAPTVTLWDAFHAPLVRGREELDALRDARPADGAQPVEILAADPVIDVFGDIAVVRHTLTVRYGAGKDDDRVRNTSVWRRVDGRWLCEHNHEDLLP